MVAYDGLYKLIKLLHLTRATQFMRVNIFPPLFSSVRFGLWFTAHTHTHINIDYILVFMDVLGLGRATDMIAPQFCRSCYVLFIIVYYFLPMIFRISPTKLYEIFFRSSASFLSSLNQLNEFFIRHFLYHFCGDKSNQHIFHVTSAPVHFHFYQSCCHLDGWTENSLVGYLVSFSAFVVVMMRATHVFVIRIIIIREHCFKLTHRPWTRWTGKNCGSVLLVVHVPACLCSMNTVFVFYHGSQALALALGRGIKWKQVDCLLSPMCI